MHAITHQEVLDRFPGAPLDHDNIDYYRGLLQRVLLVNRCADCGYWSLPARGLCPACWSDAVEPQPVSGRGTLHSLTLLHQGPNVEGVDYASPYPVGVVELVEQPNLRVAATLASPDLKIGDLVQLSWLIRAGIPVPAFARSE